MSDTTNTNKKRVLVIQQLHPAGMAMLEARDDVEIVVVNSLDEDVIAEAAKDVHGMTVRGARITKRIMDAAPDLMVVSRHGVGYDAVDLNTLNARGIPLCIAIHSNMISVAEQAMAFLLTLAKEVSFYDPITRKNDWAERYPVRGVDLEGKNLLIVGFGRIGSKVAKRANGFDMKVFAYDPYVDDAVIRAGGAEPISDYNAALGDMDAVLVHCMKTAETTNMFSDAQFKAMKSSAIIVNCARGGIIDEAALYTALTTGEIRSAGLDVLLDEPSPADHPLFTISPEKLVLSPHIAGVTVESMERMATQTVDNVLRVFDGRPDPECVVNTQVLKS
ncbi:MAG: hydroxyacid dehydrogenase [Proteobacteria bacterium]|nr:hydroxyacid dehydrogenase [Pseudomonadota bacterium]MDA1311206.1 hydroxyacid dehydrogenase [Pseudomonadota bacterium]